jgi:undecaprenyl diphosphate synthase
MSDTNSAKLPQHIAIIMDGNGRWAKEQGWSRIRGHQAGAKTVRIIVEECARLGIKQLTLYAFSRENWRRPKLEVALLMRLLKQYLLKERATMIKNNIRFTAIGRLGELAKPVQEALAETMEITQKNTGLTLCLALNYGGRAEIVDAARRILDDYKNGTKLFNLEEITEEFFSRYLYDPAMQDPDLLIRTAGEMRLSNFLLWQASYTEFWTTQTLWPDFREKDLDEAIKSYGTRVRKYGGL